MSGNLFEDRNWLLPPNYLDNENKNEHKNTTNITSPRPPVKEEEPKVNEKSAEKCRWGPDCPFCKNQETLMTLDGKILQGIFEHERLKPTLVGTNHGNVQNLAELRQIMNTDLKFN